MLKIFDTDQEFNKVATEFYNLISDEEVEDIINFFGDSYNVEQELMEFYDLCNQENKKIDKRLLKMFLENASYTLLGIRDKSFEKTIDNDIESRGLEENRNDYYGHFLPTFSKVEPMIVNIYKKYYEIVISKGNKEDLKEMKAIYQTICYYLFRLLPKDYQNSLIEKEEFSSINSIKEDFETPNDYYISKIDYKIRSYILKKYNIDLFEVFYKDQRETYSKNINKF